MVKKQAASDPVMQLQEMMRGFWHSRILFIGQELGIFDLLAGKPQGVKPVVKALGTDERATEIVLNALTALGFLIKENNKYAVSPAYSDYLVTGGRRDLTSMMAHLRHMWDSWEQLDDTMKTGRPSRDVATQHNLAMSEEMTRHFIQAMHQNGQPMAAEVARRLDLAKVNRVLDVGGGPGTYCLDLAKKKNSLHAVVFDRQVPLEVARKNISEAGLAERVTTQVGDALQDDFGTGYDLVIMSQLIHAFSPAECEMSIRKAAQALNPGGALVINEFALNEDKVSPPYAAIFAVNMLANTEGGRTYTIGEISAWMRKAKLKDIRSEDLLERSTLIYGTKAGKSPK